MEKNDGELMQILGKWFDKPLSELPKKQRKMAELYIPRWLELSSAERRACAIEASRKVQETIALRLEQARLEQNALPSGLAAQDAMRRGFNKVVRERAGERDFESKTEEANLFDDRCIKLAQMPELEIAEWIELTGVCLGEIGPYLVTLDSVGFVRWEPDEIRTYPKEFQVDMLRRNKHEPLKFPCTPARLLDFIDSEFSTIYGRFEVPDAFRQAVNVTESAQAIDTTPQVPVEPQELAAPSGASKSVALQEKQAKLLEIIGELERYAEETNQPFDRYAMPGPLGDNWNEEGSFHWFCAKFGRCFKKAKTTFESYRSGICAVQKYAKAGDFYSKALPHMAPMFGKRKK